jgi:1-acyl-sn-glycerol-3-phosphate acyltransferase
MRSALAVAAPAASLEPVSCPTCGSGHSHHFIDAEDDLGGIGYLIGVFWTVPQEYRQKRRAIFERAARALKRSGESVYLSPEGERITDGTIGPFNKGAFHLATDLRAPIVPLYIAIPRSIDPGKGLAAGTGVVHVYVGQPIATTHWRVDDVEKNRDAVRDLFVRWRRELAS